MTVLVMNERLLNLICMIQSAKVLFLSEKLLFVDDCAFDNEFYTESSKVSLDWISRLEVYYFSINSAYVKSLGLNKSRDCFDALELFEVTDEMVSVASIDLYQFTFTY
ncbi:MAG: hypothetical protein ACI80S_002110 [Pseudohongiellaceae bacterium]|jgi:hypothetical protein